MTRLSTLLGHHFPLEEGETELPSQISYVDLDSGMTRPKLHKVQHPHVGVHAFDPSGIGWRDILIWYTVESVGLMEMGIVYSKSQWELLDTEGTRGPCWH